MMCRAQASSSARVAGRQLKIRRRLGVSPGPVALNGPVTREGVEVRMPDRVAACRVELRMNGCSRGGLIASLRSRNAARDDVRAGRERHADVRPRSSMSSPAFVMFIRLALKSSSPPIAEEVHARAVHGVFELVLVLEAAHRRRGWCGTA